MARLCAAENGKEQPRAFQPQLSFKGYAADGAAPHATLGLEDPSLRHPRTCPCVVGCKARRVQMASVWGTWL